MFNRQLLKTLKKATEKFGVVSITGPRQSGKTTLSKLAFPKYDYVNLEDLSVFQRIKDDPKTFIDSISSGVIIDEIQKLPELLSYIQISIDKNYQAGKFIITGSQNLLLSNKISQSLAGRVAVMNLLPLSIKELSASKYYYKNPYKMILQGFYPGKIIREIDKTLFYASYLETYIERDVRALTNVGNLTNFKRFLSVLAGRTGRLINLSQLGNDIGINHKTVESWLSILEASYIVFRLSPYYKNYGKRIIKSSKIYFHDVGLACYLLEIDSIKELKNHFLQGELFENLIINEMLKEKVNQYSSANLYFWRSQKGHEIDLLISNGNGIIITEIKAGQSYNSDFIKNIEYFKTITTDQVKSFLIYTGESSNPIKGSKILNWHDLKILKKHAYSI